MSADGHTRRAALTRAALALGVLALGAPRPVAAAAPRLGDPALLREALEVERAAAATYAAIHANPRVDRRLRAAAGRFEAHEYEHAGALQATLGGVAGAPPLGLELPLATLALRARDPTLALGAAIEVEELAIAVYARAQRDLSGARLLRLTAQIMAGEGQHLAVLRELAGRPPVPGAFEAGTRTPG